MANGQLEIVNAGWSMHDEAVPHYEDMINNMYIGHKWLQDEFGVIPRIGWHVDPFGHSNANPRLFADMNFDAWFFARLDYEDKNQRLANKEMNFLWRPFSEHFGDEKQIFTSAMRDHYCWPEGFWYDERWYTDDPMVADPDLDTYNADSKLQQLLSYIIDMEGDYLGDHMFIPFGCDFSFANARMNFDQMDLIIEYFNKHNNQNITTLYSTPEAYIDALYSQNITWPVKYDDMFPYADNNVDPWTGYYTSRALAKKEVREGQSLLHASNKLFSLKVLDQSASDEEIKSIKSANWNILDAMGVYQHHDGITGTAQQHVADNYHHKLDKARAHVEKVY